MSFTDISYEYEAGTREPGQEPTESLHHACTLEVILENVIVQASDSQSRNSKRKGNSLRRRRIHTDVLLVGQSAMTTAVTSPVVTSGHLSQPPVAMATETAPAQRWEGTCMDLALEGERLCKSGDCRTGVQYFEAAVQVGTDDLKTLSAIYSQLGNAYFYLQEYGRALEYHKHDLNLARTIGDRLGEAKASGNLGNTLKVLGKFSEAIACCQRHLDISKQLADKIGEARALYNLGNVYHAKGKHAGRSGNQDPGDFPADVKESLQHATEYYEQNLSIVKELGDRAAQGRACGNLGNTHYLLGNFSTAISYHEQRLAIAREFGDKSAERRAYNNMGNAHIFLGEFEVAAEHYKKTLQLAKQLNDQALEAQACYSLGNTYTLLKDYERAIEYHLEHLRIARELQDRVGEGRACWSLGNAQASLGNHEKALQYASRHLQISREIGDQTGQITAQMNLTDLRTILGLPPADDASDTQSLRESIVSESDVEIDVLNKRPARFRRLSMENMELVRITPDKSGHKGARPRPPKLQKAATVASGVLGANKAADASPGDDDSFFELLSRFQSRRIDDQRCSMAATSSTTNHHRNGGAVARDNDHHNNNNTPAATVNNHHHRNGGAVARDNDHHNNSKTSSATAGRHRNNGACAMERRRGTTENKENILADAYSSGGGDGLRTSGQRAKSLTNSTIEQDQHAAAFFDMLAGLQGSRMNDQRAQLPSFPGLHNQEAVIGPLVDRQQRNRNAAATGNGSLDDQFFDMLMRCQSSRIEEQRSTLQPDPSVAPPPHHHATGRPGSAPQTAPTVPDEDFFSLIQRVQSNRLDEQRSAMPAPLPARSAVNHMGIGGAAKLSINTSSNQSTTNHKRGSKKKDKKDKKS